MAGAESLLSTDGRRNVERVGLSTESPFGDYNYYAWGKLGRLLIEADFKEAYQSTPPGVSFLYLDGCSSTPWLREVMLAQIARYYVKQANTVVETFHADLGRRVDGVFPRIKSMRQEKIDAARRLLFTKDKLPRQILQASVFELLFDPEQKVGIMTQRENRLAEYFLGRFYAFPARYLTEKEEQSEGTKGGWRSLVLDEVPVSLADIVETLIDVEGVGSFTRDEAETLLRSIANHFAHQLAGKVHLSPKFFSLDLESVELFRRFAYRNFPIETLKTIFFRNVLDPKRHKVGDIRDLHEFEDGSVSVYTIIEGIPFYADDVTDADVVRVMSEARRVVRRGGKFINFPWMTRDGRNLGSVEDALRSFGFEVKILHKNRQELLSKMNERELALVQRSPVFTYNPNSESLPLLIATKIKT